MVFSLVVCLLLGLASKVYVCANIKPTTTRGMIIDAGSQGSRLHIYNWQRRVFHTVPPAISYPTTDEKWTGKKTPGISAYSDDPKLVHEHLAPLIDFAKLMLRDCEDEWGEYPIFLGATGGMRELALEKREAIMTVVKKYMSDKSFCPFYFRPEYARIISGEEEAIYSWVTTNVLMGTLLSASQGTGPVLDDGTLETYGTLDLGGSSMQIAFYVPSQDILEGLYNFQLGAQKHWNVYTKSFLKYGMNSAIIRHENILIDTYLESISHGAITKSPAKPGQSKSGQLQIYSTGSGGSSIGKASISVAPSGSSTHKPSSALDSVPVPDQGVSHVVVNPCFPSDYDEHNERMVKMTGPVQASTGQFLECINSVRPLMGHQFNGLCKEVYNNDCSIGGAYMPPLPRGRHGKFIGTSTFKELWDFMMLPHTSTLDELHTRATEICSMTYRDLSNYLEDNREEITITRGENFERVQSYLPRYCFHVSYIVVLLQDGFHFNRNQTLTVRDQVNGNIVAWPFGMILYEINTMPWEFQQSAWWYGSSTIQFVVLFLVGIVVGYIIAILVIKVHPSDDGSDYYEQHSDVDSQYDNLSHFPSYDSADPEYESPRKLGLRMSSSSSSSSNGSLWVTRSSRWAGEKRSKGNDGGAMSESAHKSRPSALSSFSSSFSTFGSASSTPGSNVSVDVVFNTPPRRPAELTPLLSAIAPTTAPALTSYHGTKAFSPDHGAFSQASGIDGKDDRVI